MYIRGLFVLFIFRGYLCIRLPGLYEDDLPLGINDGPSAYVPFATTRNTGSMIRPAFKDRIAEPLYNVFTGKPTWDMVISTTTIKTPLQHNTAEETSMEGLLDKIFGNQSSRSLLHFSELETTKEETVSENAHDSARMGLNQGSGFLSNQISAGNLLSSEESGKAHSTTEPKRTHKEDNSESLNKGSVSGHLKMGLKYTGSSVNTNIHSYKNEESTTNNRPSGTTFQNPVTLPPSNMYNIQSNVEQELFGQRQSGNNAFSTDMFDPNSVNNLLTGYDPYSNSAVFATQTGSNPLNMNLRVHFDADKVNTKYMEENSENTVNNFPPGVVSLPTGAGGQESEELTNNLPQFDANKINENLLDRSWVYSDKPANVMAPAFLTSNVNRQASIISPGAKPDVFSHRENIVQGATSQVHAVKNQDNNQIIDATPEVSREHAPKFNFVPGNLYPGVSQDHGNRQFQSHAPSIAIPVFDPNSVNSQQMRFNPNSISWIQKRDIDYRSIDERKPNGNRSEHIKDSFGKPNSTFNDKPSHSSDALRNGDGTVTNITNAKHNFGNSQQATQSPMTMHAANSPYSGFNPNKLNTEQGQSNFVPGQMSPYDSSPNQYLNGKTDISFYRPSNTSAKLLNFDIGSLLGIGKGNNTGRIGMPGAFNPTSLNKMMMTTFTENRGNTGGSNATYAQSFVTSFDPNSLKQSGFSDAGGGANFGYGFDITNSSSKFSQGTVSNSGFMNGGFDANAANVGFGDVLRGGGSSGFGFGTSESSNSSASSSGFGGFGTAGEFDPNAANVGFGSTDYGMGGLGGPIGAFGGSFNADTMNAGLLGRSNSTTVKDLLSYFLGAKMKVEGGLTNDGEGNLFDSRYVGIFDPDSVNHVSYDPNKYNNIKMHFNPSDMLARNPGMDKDTLENTVKLFDPDKVNSLLKQQSFNPEAMLQYIPGVGDTETPQQTGNRNEGSINNQDLFDPFETMKELMETSNSFIPGIFDHTTTIPKSSVTSMSAASSSSPTPSSNASLFGNAPTESPAISASTTKQISTTAQTMISSSITDGTGFPTTIGSTTSSISLVENSTKINT